LKTRRRNPAGAFLEAQSAVIGGSGPSGCSPKETSATGKGGRAFFLAKDFWSRIFLAEDQDPNRQKKTVRKIATTVRRQQSNFEN
jgi:hypothetical protein